MRAFLLLVWITSVAAADPCPAPIPATTPRSAEEVATAKSLFTKGLKLQGSGKLDEACKMFESSMHLDPQIGTRLNVAECREVRGRYLESHALFVETAEVAERAGDRRVGFAKSRITALEARLVQVTLNVAEPALAGLAVTVASCPVGTNDLGKPRFAMPGPIVVEATAPARKPLRIEKNGAPGEQLTVDVPALAPYTDAAEERRAKEAEALAALERRKAAQLAVERQREVDSRYDRHPARTWTLVTGGLGAAAIVTGAVFGVRSRNNHEEFKDAGCGDRDHLVDAAAYAECVELRDGGKRDALLGNVLIGGGAAVLLTSMIVFIIDPGNVERPPSAQVRLTPRSIDVMVRW